MRDTTPTSKLPTIIVTTPTETAYHEGLREITGRVGVASWQVKLLQAWWQSCHLDTSISKGVVSSCCTPCPSNLFVLEKWHWGNLFYLFSIHLVRRFGLVLAISVGGF